MSFPKIPSYAIVKTLKFDSDVGIARSHIVFDTRGVGGYKPYAENELGEAETYAQQLTNNFQLRKAAWEVWVFQDGAWKYVDVAKSMLYAERLIVEYDKELVAIVYTPTNEIIDFHLYGMTWSRNSTI